MYLTDDGTTDRYRLAGRCGRSPARFAAGAEYRMDEDRGVDAPAEDADGEPLARNDPDITAPADDAEAPDPTVADADTVGVGLDDTPASHPPRSGRESHERDPDPDEGTAGPESPWTDRSTTDPGPDFDPGSGHGRESDRGLDDRTTARGDGRDSDGRSTGHGVALDEASGLAESVMAVVGEDRTDSGLLGRLRRALGAGRRAGLADSYDADEHGPLATFEAGTDIEERDRYWVNYPYALVAILVDRGTNDRTYRVVEPDLDPVERKLLSMLEDDVRDALLYRSDAEGEVEDTEGSDSLLRRELDRNLAEYDVEVTPRRFETLYYYLHRSFQGYDSLDPLMHDPHAEDISCDGYDLPIFVYHDTYGNIETTVSFPKSELDDAVVRLAQRSGRHVSLGQPVVEATLPDGSRAELALGTEVTPRGSAFTIRRYAEDPFTPLDLIANGTFSTEQIAYLWLCIEHDRNLLFAGGTASGKTTAMNAVSMFVPPQAKVLSIEDTRELSLHHDNWLSSITRERFGSDSDVTMYDLLRSALRHRPEHIIVGEVRGKEAMTLFQAMNTGHTTYSTMHADSVRTVINRLENEPINVPRQMVQSLDVLCVQGFGNVNGERVRRNKNLAEIERIDERTGELDYSTAYEWSATEDSHVERGSEVTEAIREGQGWSRTELLQELKRRRTFLRVLADHGVDDYRRFTAAVKSYYADPERTMAIIDDASSDGDSDADADTDAEAGTETGTTAGDDHEPGEAVDGSADGPTDGRTVDDQATDDSTNERRADRDARTEPDESNERTEPGDTPVEVGNGGPDVDAGNDR